MSLSRQDGAREFHADRAALRFAGFVFAYGGALLLACALGMSAYVELVVLFGDPR